MSEARAESRINMISKIKSVFGGIPNTFKIMLGEEDKETIDKFNKVLEDVENASNVNRTKRISRGQVGLNNIKVKNIVKEAPEQANIKSKKREGREH